MQLGVIQFGLSTEKY